ncbi:MAG: hypothetical protein HY862_04010 [Chloroflexi bacterium]|nr:hypothetical protein [Chloroflexota bacterium]
MTNEWEEKYQQAWQAYGLVVSTESIPIFFEERKTAAKSFRELIQEFDNGGPAALEILEHYTRSDYPYMAFRILVEMTNPDALGLVVTAISESGQARVGKNAIRILGKQDPLPDDLWQHLAKVVEQDQFGNRSWILEALLNHKTTSSIELVKRLFARQNRLYIYNDVLAKALARWGDFDQLSQIIQTPPEPVEEDRYYGNDVRIDAAFYLALHSKDEHGIEALLSIAESDESHKAAQAILKLAYLARPEATLLVDKILRSNDDFVVGFGLSSTQVLGTAFLANALLYLASKTPEFRDDSTSIPLADEAIRVLYTITGQSGPEQKHLELPVEELTQESRDESIAFYRAILGNFILSKRYSQGELLTLPLLVDNLTSRHIGPIWKSAYNLPAITGLDFGFDPDLDLISNLDAVIAWREYAATSTVLEPGGWAFNGQPLLDPVF